METSNPGLTDMMTKSSNPGLTNMMTKSCVTKLLGKINGLIFIEPVTATVAPCSHGSRGLRARTKRPTAHPHLGDGRDSKLPIADNDKHVHSHARAPLVITTTRPATKRRPPSSNDTEQQRKYARSTL